MTWSLSGFMLLAMDRALIVNSLKPEGNINYIRDGYFAIRGIRAKFIPGCESSATDESLSTHSRVHN